MEELAGIFLEAVFTIVGILIAGAVSYFAPRVKHWLDKKADKDNLGIIESVVDMAVELMEKELKGESGEEKFIAATDYVAMMAERYGIEVSGEFIKGAVQSGYRRMKEKQKNEKDEK